MRHALALICALGALAFSGCEARPPVGGCAFTYECSAGSVCRDGFCVVVEIAPSDAGTTTDDAGSTTRDAGQTMPDGGPLDAGATMDGGTDGGARLTFAPSAYRRCRDDLECAVFGGNCVIELTLSRPADAGVDRVKVSDLDPSFAVGEGVCTLPCTSDPRICDSITVTSPSGQSAPFTCQVVYAASSPYPSPAPAFPFDTQLDPVSMARGVPFASVCRPPFQFSLSHSESFCQACTEDMQCGATGACFMERGAASPRSGSCVESCSATQPCAFGFTCATLPGSTSTATYCVPSAGTCGRCRDADGDLRGVGRCGPITQPNTAVDCDDGNPVAYFDAANPGHAFPAVCGVSDVNCNGKSDDVEQLGGTDHCSACGDVCVGRAGDIPHARKACLPRSTTSSFACVADCEPGYADCDGDVGNGCEQQLGANSIYAEDADGDGRGSMTNFRYVCSGAVPAGWVQNRLDCNDGNAAIYGGNGTLAAGPELCDGLDNNCNGIADDPGFIVDEGSTCNTGVPGVCAAGTKKCTTVAPTADGGAGSGSFSCVGLKNPATQTLVAEACDGLDNNCNGQTDEGLDYYEAQGQQNPNGSGAPAACSVPSGKGICGQGAYACTTVSNTLIDGGTRTTGTWSCVANLPQATDVIDDLRTDTNCDGSDGDLSQAIFVRPTAGGGALDGKDTNDGSAQRPVATVQRAIALACANGAPCKDIYLEATDFTSNAALRLPTFTATGPVPPVRIYGGFVATISCGVICEIVWTRGTEGTGLIREAPARGSSPRPFGTAYAGLEADNGTGLLSVLLDQVRVEVNAPDPSTILNPGDSAPSQLGFVCPPRGCGLVQFRNVVVTVEAAMHGANGAAAPPTGIGDVNGRDGCDTNNNCTDVPFLNGEWMQYAAGDWPAAYNIWSNDKLPGRAAASCPDGWQNNGGSSAAIRWQPSGGGDRSYNFTGLSGEGTSPGGGGRCWDTRDAGRNPQQPYAFPGRGGNGSGGSGSSRAGSFNFRFFASGNTWNPSHGFSFTNASIGRSGSGGGGGGGCINHDNYFSCPAGEYRGGGGGAGGCGGWAGGNGGDGGNTVGLVLTSSATSAMTLSTSGTFRVTVGNAGRGGNGANGGASAAGGYGGLAPNRNGYLNGGHGGDGGGGGGGSGGVGGSSIGIYRRCQRAGATEADGCGMTLPPIVLAAPGSFVSIGTAGTAGTAGAAGVGTAKPQDFNGRTDSVTPSSGGPGAVGANGRADTLFFNN